MDMHKNARTTPRSRAEIVRRVLEVGQRPTQVAAGMGISVRTVRKWVARYQHEREAGLAERSCRPRRQPSATPRRLVRWVLHLRRQRWTGTDIAARLRLSPATVARLLRRHGLARLRSLEPPRPVRRYQRQRPGSLLHVDTKKLGRIGRIGHRRHSVRSHERRQLQISDARSHQSIEKRNLVISGHKSLVLKTIA